MPGSRAALEHELADCLRSVLILAHRYDVDLDAAFLRTMDELDRSINGSDRSISGSGRSISGSGRPVSGPGTLDGGPG
ncbi:hypothetical protein [Streptomyces sp. NPDC102264]|uniref:hypothetical protein n=1 Tax=Streptomyces sp. NPDC102264 TaxID=3366149 RepID=UPI003801388C